MQTTVDLKKHHETVVMLEHEIQVYLGWMADNVYSKATQEKYRRILGQLLSFVRSRRYHWKDVFTYETMILFKNSNGLGQIHGVSGFTRYLYAKGKIATPRPMRKPPPSLPAIYEDYLVHHKRYRQATDVAVAHIRRVLVAFDAYCQRSGIELRSLRIEHVDAFHKAFFKNFKEESRGVYRNYRNISINYGSNEKFPDKPPIL